ncbi:nucleotide-binding protein [Vannielia litorea]|uniref:nucleotide-binding protein n=1 Tax=Vannielia litorea TaxID=1217970 RepID=UPI001BCDFD93|nr:hypothetical protein [Vannielia litorea]
MQSILIAARKGGAGKTTLARKLSVAASQGGLGVLCLDLGLQPNWPRPAECSNVPMSLGYRS